MPKANYIIKTAISKLKAPLLQPFRTALGQHDSLENVLFTLHLSDSAKGFGEAAIATHITGETIEETTKNLKIVGQSLVGTDASNYLRISAQLHERLPHNKSAVAAIETALIDALTRQWKIPLWKFFGSKAWPFSTDITIVIADLEETEESVKKFYKQGFRTFKVKIGRDEDLDIKRVLAVKRLAPRCAIYLDANQGYSAGQTLKIVEMLRRFKVCPRLIEQPVPKDDWEGLKKLTRLAGIPICADESVCSLADCIRAIREKAVNAINIKLMKTGIFHSREIAILAKAAGMKLMIGGMMETSLAMTASAHLASGLGGFDFIDLDTPFFIKPRFDRNPYLSRQGVYDLRKVKEGIGIIPKK